MTKTKNKVLRRSLSIHFYASLHNALDIEGLYRAQQKSFLCKNKISGEIVRRLCAETFLTLVR